MLDVPVVSTGTKTKQLPAPPCYQCLFDKPISDGWCNPESCKMLDAWIADEDFSWDKYVLKWLTHLEQENLKRLQPILDE